MTVIIKEVVVNTTVNSDSTSVSKVGTVQPNTATSHDETINECVEQVMRILRDKNEA